MPGRRLDAVGYLRERPDVLCPHLSPCRLLTLAGPSPVVCTCFPPRSPWASPEYEGLLVESSRKGLLTLGGFLSKLAVTTAADPRRTLAYAYYLGWVAGRGPPFLPPCFHPPSFVVFSPFSLPLFLLHPSISLHCAEHATLAAAIAHASQCHACCPG